MITQEQVLKALSNVQEPDLGKDLVTLNMVKDVIIDNDTKTVQFTVVLTTPACPLKDMIRSACENAIKFLVDKEAKPVVKFTANVNSNRKDGKTVLPGVKNIIAVASGKGGVGKSTISVNLAIALANSGATVGIIDADITGPSIPIMFGVRGERPFMEDIDGVAKILPLEKFGVKLLSIGLMIDDKQAVAWRGPMVSSAIRQLITDVHWGDLDYLILDMPPGTGDVHLTIAQTVPVTGAIVVTTPQEVALADAKRAIMMFDNANIKIPVFGIVENMAWFTPEELPDNKYFIFGEGGGLRLAEQFEMNVLAQIPLMMGVRTGGDDGLPAAMSKDNKMVDIFSNLASTVARQVAMRNANMPATKILEVTV
jgi:ATP-binding protein involved in chromosome partitioning